MKWFAFALIILFLLLLLIIVTKITVLFSYYHGQDNDDLKIKFKAWFGLITYKINVPLIKIAEDSPAIVYKEEIQVGTEDTQIKRTKKNSR